MTFGKVTKGVLFCAGMIGGTTAGNLFYLERYMPGVAMLGLTAVFLFFAMYDLTHHRRDEDDELAEALAEQQRTSAELGLMLADIAVDCFKRIGRTMPCTQAELEEFESDFLPLLNSLKVPRKERERIVQEIEKLKTRSRQNEGRRAFSSGKL